MKNIFLLLALLNIAPLAHASDAAWNKSVLKTLNKLCGDVWCEGDYQFDFKEMNCNFGLNHAFAKKGACVVEFSMQEQGATTPAISNASCTMIAYANETSVSKGGSYDPHLSDRFYKELDNCISVWEARAAGKI